MKAAAAKTSALLSLLFIVVYGACNWITSRRSDVGTWYFEWERQIPFLPLMIIPYMSIDLFFVAGPFLCRTREELRTLAWRIGFAIVTAGVCFLLLPLQFAFARPQGEGWLGAIYQFLHGFDQPHNLFPSLHITLRTILADLYARHTQGAVRGASHVWFSLVGFSTVLTYQHHVVDVAGGFALAALCFYVFREEPGERRLNPNRRVGAYYAVGVGVALSLAWVGGRWGMLLLWPAMSLALVATAYFGFGPSVYRKSHGCLPLSSCVVLGPYLLGQQLSLLYYRRQCRPWNEVAPGVWIGRKLSRRESEAARRQGVTAVLDLTCEFSETRTFRNLNYANVQILDLTAPTPRQLDEAVAFLEAQAARGTVYVHCKVGYSRSAAVACAWLLATGQVATLDEAMARVRKARPSIVIRPEVHTVLREWDRGRCGERQ